MAYYESLLLIGNSRLYVFDFVAVEIGRIFGAGDFKAGRHNIDQMSHLPAAAKAKVGSIFLGILDALAAGTFERMKLTGSRMQPLPAS